MHGQECRGPSWGLPQGRLCWSETGKLCFSHAKCGALGRALTSAPRCGQNSLRATQQPPSPPPTRLQPRGMTVLVLFPPQAWVKEVHGAMLACSSRSWTESGPSWGHRYVGQRPSSVFLLGRQIIGDASLQQEPLYPGQKGEGGLGLSPSNSLEGGGKAASCPYQGSPQPGCKISQVCLSASLPAQRP